MRAVTFDSFGPPEVFYESELPMPMPGHGEVLVRVEACGVCRHDVLHRAGQLPGATAGVVLGHEVAGVVEKLGAGVRGVQVGCPIVVYHKPFDGTCVQCLRGRTDMCEGDLGVSMHYRGGYGEFVVVPERNCLPLPDDVSLVGASVLPCAFGTSLRALHTAAAEPGQTVVVVGAAGGLGAQQVQLASALGLHIIAVTRSPMHHDELRALGADECIASPDSDFAKSVKEVTGGRGAEIVLDNVVSATLNASLRSLAKSGAVVLMGNIEVQDIPIRPGLLIYRRLSMIGSGGPTLAEMKELVGMYADRALTPVVSEIFPAREAAEAHRKLESGGGLGRVVLVPGRKDADS